MSLASHSRPSGRAPLKVPKAAINARNQTDVITGLRAGPH